jgi:choline dehydrogenase-like flavoprotein
MLINARDVENQTTLNTDICIIGAGPAGITIAREFNGQGLDVLLLESGGFQPDSKIEALSDGHNEGDPYPPPGAVRERLFGGTANIWPIHLDNGRMGVRYVPLDPIDFEKRDWVPYSGWPITRTDLDPYYERAHQVAQSGPYSYGCEAWECSETRPVVFKSQRMATQMFHFGPRDIFTDEYRRELVHSPNVTVVTYAHALELETDEVAKTVTGVKVGVVGGSRFQIAAKTVILTQGGLETARFLLLSNAVQRCGLGNGHDLVGRFLMDHPVIRPGVLIPQNPEVVNRLALYDARWVNGARVIAKPILTAEIQQQEQLLNIATAIFPRPGWARYNLLRMIFPNGQRPSSPALHSARTLYRGLKKRQFPTQGLQHLGKTLLGLDDLAFATWRLTGRNRFSGMPFFSYDFDHGGWSNLPNQAQKFGCFDLLHVTEQAPDPNNQVALSSEQDSFGYRRMVVHWRYSDFGRCIIER